MTNTGDEDTSLLRSGPPPPVPPPTLPDTAESVDSEHRRTGGSESRLEEVDEYGLPYSWRREEAERRALNDAAGDVEQGWQAFSTWCSQRGAVAFPATAEVVLEFIESGALRGPDLFESWLAITAKHSSWYWHTDADPVTVLQVRGISVLEDGTVKGT